MWMLWGAPAPNLGDFGSAALAAMLCAGNSVQHKVHGRKAHTLTSPRKQFLRQNEENERKSFFVFGPFSSSIDRLLLLGSKPRPSKKVNGQDKVWFTAEMGGKSTTRPPDCRYMVLLHKRWKANDLANSAKCSLQWM